VAAAFATFALLARWLVFPLAYYVLACRFSKRDVAGPIRIALYALTALVVLATFVSIKSATHYLQEWDFIAFWQFGHAAVAHLNVYAPQTYRQLGTPIPVDAIFRRESMDVGFVYPPPTILLFVPLGFVHDVKLASIAWLVVMLAALLAGVVALARTYAGARAWDVTFAIVALGFALPATADNVAYHQTSFLAFVATVFAYRYRSSAIGGIAAGIAAIVKPYLGIVVLWFALRRRWNALAASLVTLAVASIASLPFIGPGALHDYVFDNPAKRYAPGMFAESEISSLYAVLLHAFHREASVVGPLHDPLFVAIAALATVATVWTIVRARAIDDDLSLPLGIALALMLYPGSSSMYAIVLVPALVALAYRVRSRRAVAVATAIAMLFFIGNIIDGAWTFAAFVVLWLVLAVALSRDANRARGGVSVP
jgi:hypothetical protein